MTDLEDLSAKAARLWLEFMQAQAKAAAQAAAKLPEVTRTLAEAGLPLAAEVNRWVAGAATGPDSASDGAQATDQREAPSAAPPVAPVQNRTPVALLQPNHRRIVIRKSLSRRRARRT
jgi:hypothetical protein